jgi:hypothetical protein
MAGIGSKTNEQYLHELKNANIQVFPREVYQGIFTKIMHICTCGNEWLVTPHSILFGNLCGCQTSKAEKIINEWCKNNGIIVKRQMSFPDLISPKGRKLRYDFGIYKDDKLFCLVEYHGKQHFEFTNKIWFKSEEDVKYALKRDKIKRNYAKDKKIPLLEITYKDKDICEKLKNELYNIGYFDLFTFVV